MIEAVLMNLDSFNAKFNRDVPADGRHGKEGYCIKYFGAYTSWSPKSVFESAYREISNDGKALIQIQTIQPA